MFIMLLSLIRRESMRLRVVFFLCMSCVAQGYNSYQVAQLKKPVAAGSSVTISGCDFRGAGKELLGISFAGVIAGMANFDQCTQATKLPGLIEVVGQVTDLTGANFQRAVLCSASFKNAILKNVNFTDADISYVNFSNADLTGALLDQAIGYENAVFCGATMPDGTKCSNGSWVSKVGKTFTCQCPKSAKNATAQNTNNVVASSTKNVAVHG